MFSAFRKDIYREIKKSIGRFIAIFAIVFLGVAFYTGIGSTGMDMKITGDRFFNQKNLMDIRIVSTYGVNDMDIAAIKNVEGVEEVYPAYNIDAIVNSEDIAVVVKVHGVKIGAETVNNPNLLVGRMPLEDDEAIAEIGFAGALGLRTGDSFMLESGNKTDLRDSLKHVRYKLVGIVNSVYYVSNVERGPSSIGSGSAHVFMYIPDSNFLDNIYHEAFVTVSGARDYPCYGDEYKNLVKGVTERLEALGRVREKERYIEATGDAYSDLAAAEAELAASREAAAGEYERLYEDIYAVKISLEATRRDLMIRQGDLNAGVRELDYAKERLRNGITALDEAFETALSRERELSRAGVAIVEALAVLDNEAAGLTEKENLLRAAYMDEPQLLSAFIARISEARSKISATRESLQYDLETAQAGEASAREAMAGISANRDDLKKELFGLGLRAEQIDAGGFDIIEGYASVNRGINDLDRQLRLLDEREADTLRFMEQTSLQHDAAGNTLLNMEKPKWYVSDRDSNPGYSGFFNDADKVEALGRVFPFIFFTVAALVSLTTMTRLVDERRTEIGTLKSLGYGGFRIMSKYILYAAIPTFLGGFLGGIIGMRFFPIVILTAYQLLYAIPEPVTVLDGNYWVFGASLGVLSTMIATAAACMNALRSPPQVLMRPKPPKKGSRIFLERIKPIWAALTFIWKVTIRNIFRYKKRFFMTIAGVAGCTALLLTGFGLKDSINTLINRQYSIINLYDIVISFSDTAKSSDMKAVEETIMDSEIVRGVMPLRMKTFDSGSYGGGASAVSVNVVVPSDAEAFRNYTSLRNRATDEKLSIAEGEVLITEKLADLLDLGRGDIFYIEAGGERYDLTVGGITENYYLHFIYMHKNLYARLFEAPPENNMMYILLGEYEEEQKHLLANSILEQKSVGAIFITSILFNAFSRMLKSLNFVIYVLIISAAALAVVVLMNLTNINISERTRELATIEVLGFYDGEVTAYIYRENTILTIIGLAAGLVSGVYLHAFVVRTAETQMIMFGRLINTESFFYSILLTILFSAFVNIITSRKLRAVNMVEALKSVE